MALRIEWDKFEVALLIDACEQVLNKKITKPKIVSELSYALRLRAQNSGIDIDDTFRNENGIYLQMTKMDYLLTDGKVGLPGASKLYAEIAELRRNNPEEFDGVLKQAKEQIGKKEAKTLANNKEDFSLWLPSRSTKKFTSEQIIKALEEGSDYCRSHGICKESFWSVSEISRFSAITSRLVGMRLFRLTHRKLATVLDKAIPLYKEFLKEKESVSKEIDNRGGNEVLPVSAETKIETPSSAPVDLVYSKDDSDEVVRRKLDLVTKILLKRYCITPASSLSEITNNNKDIPVSYLNIWTKKVENQTAAQYLIAKGVIQKVVDTRSEEEKRAEKLSKLNEVTSVLLTRYAGKPITSLTELIKQNPDVPVASVSTLAKELVGQTASEFFREKGILIPLTPKTTEEKLQDAINQIKASLGEKHLNSLSEVKECGIGVTITTLNNWSKSVYGKPISEYLIEENILVKDSLEYNPEKREADPNSYGKAIAFGTNEDVDDEDDEEDEEPDDDSDREPIDPMELSLFKTLEYLKTRYNVRQHYDHIINSERSTLYKVRNHQKDIMWVYYIHTKSSHYISIETEPEYLVGVSDFVGFTCVPKRSSDPRQKLFFQDYGSIWQTLVAICDSIDRYFAAFIPAQSQPNPATLSQKLYSISKVYDDPVGLSLSRILSMLGNEADEEDVLDILDHAPWAYRLSEGRYSFSKKDEKPDQILHFVSECFPHGIRPTSIIDINKLKRQYSINYGEDIPADIDLPALLSSSGIHIGEKVYILTSEQKKDLVNLITSIFAEGYEIVYYSELYLRNSELLESCHLYEAPLMQAVFSKILPMYVYKAEWIQASNNASSVNDICQAYGSDLVLTYQQIKERCPYLTLEVIRWGLSKSERFVWSSQETYAQADLIQLDPGEVNTVIREILPKVKQDGFFSLAQLPLEESCALNSEVSSSAVRDVMFMRHMACSCDKHGLIVTPKGAKVTTVQLLEGWCKGLDRLTINELESYERELTGHHAGLGLWAACHCMVRIDHDHFVSDNLIEFDVDAIDHAISLFVGDRIISITSITSFTSFPDVPGFSWNLYLVESFLRRFSKRFSIEGGPALISYVGGICSINRHFDSYEDRLAHAVVQDGIPLTEGAIGKYLTERRFILRRSDAVRKVLDKAIFLNEQRGDPGVRL